MSNGPLPTTLTLLSSLSQFETGCKVRFLGCVTAYDLPTGTLSLQHAYPTPSSASALSTIALVDVNLLLEGLKREDTTIGAWLNVVGYVEGVLGEVSGQKGKGKGEICQVKVQAVMLWSAGAFKIGEYEKAVEGRLGK